MSNVGKNCKRQSREENEVCEEIHVRREDEDN